jgi:hypothetical protein
VAGILSRCTDDLNEFWRDRGINSCKSVSVERAKAKNVTRLIYFIVRVRRRSKFEPVMSVENYNGIKSVLMKNRSIVSSSRPVSHRSTNVLKSTMSGICIVFIIVNHALQIKYIKSFLHLKLIM